jgi:hypothetical protein
MRWPWRHRDEGGHERAEEALRRTRERRREQERRDGRFGPVADRIREMRERNHLAEAVEAALREGGR